MRPMDVFWYVYLLMFISQFIFSVGFFDWLSYWRMARGSWVLVTLAHTHTHTHTVTVTVTAGFCWQLLVWSSEEEKHIDCAWHGWAHRWGDSNWLSRFFGGWSGLPSGVHPSPLSIIFCSLLLRGCDGPFGSSSINLLVCFCLNDQLFEL